MIKFDILTVSADGSKLIIGASVLDIPYYKDVKISRVLIDTHNTFESTRPSSKAWVKTFDKPDKSQFIEITKDDFDDNNVLFPDPYKNLFFVYIECEGSPSIDLPCSMQSKYTLGTTYNTCIVREQLMYYVKQVKNTCKIPKEFINLFLRYKALDVALCQGHYPEAIVFYLDFIKNPRLWRDRLDNPDNLLDGFTLRDTKSCGCNG